MKRVLLLLLLLSPFISKFSYSQATTVTFTAVKSGNWNDPTVWSISGTTTHTYPWISMSSGSRNTPYSRIIPISAFNCSKSYCSCLRITEFTYERGK